MNLFTISSILVLVTSTSFAILMFWKGRANKASITFGWFCLVVVIWGIGSYLFSTTSVKEEALFGWQIAHISCILTVPLYYQFVYSLLELKQKEKFYRYLLLLAYILASIFLFFNLFAKELFLGGLKFVYNQFYWIDWTKYKSPLWLLFYIIFDWILLTYSFFLLLSFYRNATGNFRNQLKYVIVGSIVGWLGAHCNYLLYFRSDFYPYSNFLIAIYPPFFAYAVIKHHLMDINIVFKKSLLYSILIAILTAIYLLLIMLVEGLFRGMLGYKSLFVSLSAAFIIALLFNPLRNRIQALLDRVFLGKTPQEMARENKLLYQELERSERLKAASTMALGLAHEIKNPLTTIKTFSEYLPEQYTNKEFVDKFSKIIPSEVKRINDIVHRLLDFSKPSLPSFKETDITLLIKDILEFLNSEFLKNKIKIEELHEKPGLLVKIDPGQIKQVLLNLILNAIDAMPKGGLITIRTSLKEDDFLEIEVSDTGSGIPKENLQNIFNPFYTTKDTGAGLGLSICHQIIKNHGGSIEVESTVGKGTRFRVRLP